MSGGAREPGDRIPPVLTVGFRPFFLLAAVWAALVVPLWLGMLAGHVAPPAAMAPLAWHAHETVFGFGAAVVAGFLLTAVPNWTGRQAVRGAALAGLVGLWCAGRLAMLPFSPLGAGGAAVLDLTFPVAFLAVIARQIVAGRNWRNLPVLGALGLLLLGNALVHLGAAGFSELELAGGRLGVATLLMLIVLIGGRIVPAFTRNWLARARPEVAAPAPFGAVDRAGMALAGVALAAWVIAPDAAATSWAALAGGLGLAGRLARWRGGATLREPLLWMLHLGYGWLAFGLLLLGLSGFWPALPASAALHALTVGAIGSMTLAMMTRVSLGHTGRPLSAGAFTQAIYASITVSAVLRLAAPLVEGGYLLALSASGAAWSGAFGLFVLAYGRPLTSPRPNGGNTPPI